MGKRYGPHLSQTKILVLFCIHLVQALQQDWWTLSFRPPMYFQEKTQESSRLESGKTKKKRKEENLIFKNDDDEDDVHACMCVM